MVNACEIKGCGHYRNLNVCISVGGAWHFANSNVTCWKSHTKVSKYRARPPLASITTLHIKLKLRISFLIAERCPPRSVVKLFHTCSIGLTSGEGAGQSISSIPFMLNVLIDNTTPVRTGVFAHKHKVLAHSTSIQCTNASIISSL